MSRSIMLELPKPIYDDDKPRPLEKAIVPCLSFRFSSNMFSAINRHKETKRHSAHNGFINKSAWKLYFRSMTLCVFYSKQFKHAWKHLIYTEVRLTSVLFNIIIIYIVNTIIIRVKYVTWHGCAFSHKASLVGKTWPVTH